MNFLNLNIDVKNAPVLDPGFIPMKKFNDAFLADATKPLAIAVERNDGLTAVYDTKIHGTDAYLEADTYYVDRMVKFLLWAKGGYKVYICGDDRIAARIADAYSVGGSRDFDRDFMANVYESAFEVIALPYDKTPAEKEQSNPVGKHMDGCRIGFDAGGSDRKVSAVIDGEAVFSEEVVWYPKLNSDPEYHYAGIVDALTHMARNEIIRLSVKEDDGQAALFCRCKRRGLIRIKVSEQSCTQAHEGIEDFDGQLHFCNRLANDFFWGSIGTIDNAADYVFR
jgi:hypothetical protein